MRLVLNYFTHYSDEVYSCEDVVPGEVGYDSRGVRELGTGTSGL